MPFIPDHKPVIGEHSPSTPSASAAAAPAEAMEGLGKAVINLSGTFLEMHQDREKERDFAIGAKASLAREQARADHLAWRETNPDPSLWEGDMARRASAVRQMMAGEKPSHRGKQQLDFQQSSWEASSIGDARLDGLKQGRANDRGNVTRLVYALRQGKRFDEAREQLLAARDVGLFTPDETLADEVSLDFEEAEQVKKDVLANCSLYIQDEPREALDLLTAKDEDGVYQFQPEMDRDDRHGLILGAERRLAQKKNEELADMRRGIASGGVTLAEIDSLPLFLEKEDKDALVAWHGRHAPPTAEGLEKAWAEVAKIRPLFQAASGRTLDEQGYLNAYMGAQRAIMSHLSRTYDGPVLDMLERYAPAKAYQVPRGQAPDKGDLFKDNEMEIRLALDHAEKLGVFGRVAGSRNPDAALEVARRRRDSETVLHSWLRTREKPDVGETRKQVDEHVAALRAGATASMITLPGGAGSRAPSLRPLATDGPGVLPPKQAEKELEDFLKSLPE